MAEEPTLTPVAEAPQGVESIPKVANASVMTVAAVSVAGGSVESGEAAGETAMEVDEDADMAATSEEKKGEDEVESSAVSGGGETAEVPAEVEGATEEAEGRNETATADGVGSEQASTEGVVVGKGESATEMSEPTPTGAIVHEDEVAERKQEETGGEETPAVGAVGVAGGTKEGESTLKITDEKESAAHDAVDVDMAPAEDAAGDKEAPAAAGEAEEERKEAESDAKPIDEVASNDATKPVNNTQSSDSVGVVKPEKEQPSEVSGKRKEREEGKTVLASNSNPKATEPAAKEVESSTKKQKVETPGETSVPSDGVARAVVATTESADSAAATIAAAPIMISRDDMAKMEEDDGVLKFDVISNDGEPEHMVQLTTLKNIFAKQLPKMPKEYIVRLVFDRNHRSMIILKNGKHVIGGICYRPFEPNHFAEIAFCAINASDQVKGYGTRLMNHLKEYVKLKGISHFLTYADNYAIGYFKKQGFSKVVSMPRPNWFGFIKDYDGGTLMECTIHHQINYLRITSMVQKQRQAILDKIKQNSKAHIVYPGLMKFAEGRLLDIYMVPGVKEAGWSQATIRNNRIGTRDPGSLKTQLTQLWKAVSSHRSAWPFHEPVDTNVVVDYLDYIKEPIDLTTIGKRVEAGAYVTKAQFKADLDKMCTNCTVYNLPDTNYYKAAMDLQEFINKRVQVRDQPR